MHAYATHNPPHITTHQGNENARKKGIGVVMRKDGSIIRRGLGQPDWREVRRWWLGGGGERIGQDGGV